MHALTSQPVPLAHILEILNFTRFSDEYLCWSEDSTSIGCETSISLAYAKICGSYVCSDISQVKWLKFGFQARFLEMS